MGWGAGLHCSSFQPSPAGQGFFRTGPPCRASLPAARRAARRALERLPARAPFWGSCRRARLAIFLDPGPYQSYKLGWRPRRRLHLSALAAHSTAQHSAAHRDSDLAAAAAGPAGALRALTPARTPVLLPSLHAGVLARARARVWCPAARQPVEQRSSAVTAVGQPSARPHHLCKSVVLSCNSPSTHASTRAHTQRRARLRDLHHERPGTAGAPRRPLTLHWGERPPRAQDARPDHPRGTLRETIGESNQPAARTVLEASDTI
jgi:hypothetical protein